MNYTKITKTEFKTWSQQLFEVYTGITAPSSGLQFQSQADREKWMRIGVLVSNNTELGVIQATFIATINFIPLNLKMDIPLKEFDNQTIKEWGKNVFGRIKEHCIANGYYKPDSSFDLNQLKERGKKVIRILLDKGEFLKYIIYADSEEREVLVNTANFFRELKKIVSPIMLEGDENIPADASFFYEDIIGRMEKLISKKEQAEKNNNPTGNSPTSPIPAQQKNNLEKEIQILQDQVKGLQEKINNTTDTTQKVIYQGMLDNTKKEIKDKEKEKDQLNKVQDNKNPKESNKLNWAIGLGIVAVVIGFICLILLASRRKER